MGIKHSKVSAVADSGDTSLVRPSDWNADHVGENVLSATTTLMDAQIKGMRTPAEIIPPTEVLNYTGTPSVLPVPFLCFVRTNFVSAYGNVPNPCQLLVVWGSDWSLSIGTLVGPHPTRADPLYEKDAQSLFLATSTNQKLARLTNQRDMLIGLDDAFQDNGLYLVFTNHPDDVTTTGDLTGGNSANTIDVTVHYTLVAL